MARQYIFYREDILGLLNNHKKWCHKKVKDWVTNGGKLTELTYSVTAKWTEEYFDEEMTRSEIKIEHIMDDVEDILQKVTGKSIKEWAKERQSNA
jgi:hypothetical protein